MPLGEGAQFAGYTVVRLLGVGGMGEVYLARHPRLPRFEALKILRADVSADPDYQQRFNREAELAAGLFHPHIVGVHDRGECDGQLWIAMDYVDGHDVGDLLRNRYPGGMPSGEVLTVVAAVASALDYAHHRGLMHRDVKPANIMVSRTDETGQARIVLSDFGIARALDDISGLTVTNMTVGTVDYCAPEQLMGHPTDGRADQYSLAASAYYLLTGKKLFSHANPVAVISAHLTVPPPRLGASRADLAALDGVFARALAKNAPERFDRCADFALALAERLQAAATRILRFSDLAQPATGPSADVAALAARPVAALVQPAPGPAAYRPEERTHARLPPGPPSMQQRPRSRRRMGLITAAAAAAVAVLVVLALVGIPRLTGGHQAVPQTDPRQQQAALRAGQQYLEALARGDAAAALALSARPPANKKVLTNEVLRAQLAAAPITAIAVTPAPAAAGDNPNEIQYLILSAKFGDTLSQARVAAHRQRNDWKLDTTVALDIGTPGSTNASLNAVALWGVATDGAASVAVFPGPLDVSSANRYVDITAPPQLVLLDALTATEHPIVQPDVALNDAGRQAAKTAIDNFMRYCYRGVAPPPDCIKPNPSNNTLVVDSSGDFTKTTFAFDAHTMVVAVNGTAVYHGHAAGVSNFTLTTDLIGTVDLSKEPPVFVRTAVNR